MILYYHRFLPLEIVIQKMANVSIFKNLSYQSKSKGCKLNTYDILFVLLSRKVIYVTSLFFSNRKRTNQSNHPKALLKWTRTRKAKFESCIHIFTLLFSTTSSQQHQIQDICLVILGVLQVCLSYYGTLVCFRCEKIKKLMEINIAF